MTDYGKRKENEDISQWAHERTTSGHVAVGD